MTSNRGDMILIKCEWSLWTSSQSISSKTKSLLQWKECKLMRWKTENQWGFELGQWKPCVKRIKLALINFKESAQIYIVQPHISFGKKIIDHIIFQKPLGHKGRCKSWFKTTFNAPAHKVWWFVAGPKQFLRPSGIGDSTITHPRGISGLNSRRKSYQTK